MTTDADEETIDAIETFGLAGADADAIARGGCGKLGRIKTLDDALNQLRLNERTERLTTTTRAFRFPLRSARPRATRVFKIERTRGFHAQGASRRSFSRGKDAILFDTTGGCVTAFRLTDE